MDNLMETFDPNGNFAEELPESLPPEEEEGNVEYKLKLVSPTPHRFEHLVTQMKWRLEEGHGEAIYEIGVEDNGMLAGLTEKELSASLSTLQRMAERLGASLTTLRVKTVEGEESWGTKKVMEILVRKVPDDQQFIDLSLAVLGNVDAGKSTLLGVLTQGELDNGRGRARLNLFRHLHEIQSGRTSSISHEILGFDGSGNVVNYSGSRSVEEIYENSTKLLTLIDLAGHHKYLKTTIFGLTGSSPDFAMLVISANSGLTGTTKEHLGLALALEVPVFVVVNKVDLCTSTVRERCLQQLESILKSPGCKKVPYRVLNEDDAINAATSFHTDRITPIFTVSAVTGQSLDLLLQFLNVLPPSRTTTEREKLVQGASEFQIDEIFNVPSVGRVAGGTVHRGMIREGDRLLLGPSPTGEFKPVRVRTVQRHRLPCRLIQAGHTAAIALLDVDHDELRKGMVLVSKEISPTACMEFEADIFVLYHHNRICTNFQTTIHIGTVCQTAFIKCMDKKNVKTNEKARVTFVLMKQPEFIRIGARFIFREGRTKGIGEVISIKQYDGTIER